jgi:class 3 adenylate cyclase
MGSEPTNPSIPKLEVAHVLFMDVVSYSRLPMDQQLAVGRRLMTIVESLPEFKHSRASGELISLWTGDGMALAFFGELTAPVQCARQILLGVKPDDGFTLRMGIHTGPVFRMADINANLNVAGGGINFAQRVMDCGDGGHILISKTTADMLTQLSGWKTSLHDLGEAVVKHGERVHILICTRMNSGIAPAPRNWRRPRWRSRISATGREAMRSPSAGRGISRTIPPDPRRESWIAAGIFHSRRGRTMPRILG